MLAHAEQSGDEQKGDHWAGAVGTLDQSQELLYCLSFPSGSIC